MKPSGEASAAGQVVAGTKAAGRDETTDLIGDLDREAPGVVTVDPQWRIDDQVASHDTSVRSEVDHCNWSYLDLGMDHLTGIG